MGGDTASVSPDFSTRANSEARTTQPDVDRGSQKLYTSLLALFRNLGPQTKLDLPILVTDAIIFIFHNTLWSKKMQTFFELGEECPCTDWTRLRICKDFKFLGS